MLFSPTVVTPESNTSKLHLKLTSQINTSKLHLKLTPQINTSKLHLKLTPQINTNSVPKGPKSGSEMAQIGIYFLQIAPCVTLKCF